MTDPDHLSHYIDAATRIRHRAEAAEAEIGRLRSALERIYHRCAQPRVDVDGAATFAFNEARRALASTPKQGSDE